MTENNVVKLIIMFVNQPAHDIEEMRQRIVKIIQGKGSLWVDDPDHFC